MKPAERVIDRFGGLTRLSEALGHKHPTTVQGWKERGYIPAQRQSEVLAAAKRLGIDLTPADFFDQPSDPPPSTTTAGTDKARAA